MYSDKDRRRLITITKRTGNEAVHYVKQGIIKLEREGQKDTVRVRKSDVIDCDMAVHTHPWDDMPFSSLDFMVMIFGSDHLRVHEVLCYKIAYRVIVPATYEPGIYDDLLVEERLRTPLCHSSHPDHRLNRLLAIKSLCKEFGWKFEAFKY